MGILDIPSISQVVLDQIGLKRPCQAASTAALASCTYSNGTSGVGATLTSTTLNAFPAIDGVASALNNRYIIMGQATTYQNGIYYLSTLGTGAVAWVLTRSDDANQPAELVAGMHALASGGTANAGIYYLTATVTTVGTTAVVFQGISGTVTSVAGRTGVVTLAVADVSGAAPLASPTFTGTVTVPIVAITGTAASSGAIRLGTSDSVTWRNASNTADIVGVKVGGPSNVVELGGATAPVFVGSASTNTAGASEKLRVNTPTTTSSTATAIITAGAIADKPLVLQGLAGQTGVLLDLQNSAGTTGLAATDTGVIRVATSAVPTAPSTGYVNIFARARTGRTELTLSEPTGNGVTLGSALWAGTYYHMTPNTSTTMRAHGSGTHATTGTVSHVTATTLVPYSSLFTTAATLGASSALNTTSLFRRGTAGNINGGFHFVGHALFADASYDKGAASTGSRIRIGITNSTTMAASLGTDHAPTANNQAIFVRDHTDGVTDTNWQFVTSNGTTLTSTDTGVAFERNAVLRFRIWCPLASTTIDWSIENLTAATETSGTVTATLPSVGSNLYAGAGVLTVDAVARTMTIPAPGIFAQTDKG